MEQLRLLSASRIPICFVALATAAKGPLPLASAKKHDASCKFGERLLVHVEEHGAKGWRDCEQCCGSHSEYMLRDVRWFELCASKGDLHFPGWPRGSLDWFRDHGVGFFTSSLASYIESLRSSTLTEQSISEDVSLSMLGRACQDVGVALGECFSRRLAVPIGSFTRAMTEREICFLVVLELFWSHRNECKSRPDLCAPVKSER